MEIATVTRFYYPVGDRRKSRFQVWLMRTDGSHRIRISHAPALYDLAWIDRDHLAWTEVRDGHEELWQIVLPSMRRRKLALGKAVGVSKGWATVDGRTFRFVSDHLVPGKLPPEVNRVEAAIEGERDSLDVRWRGRRFPLVNAGLEWSVSMGDGHYPVSLTNIPKPLDGHVTMVAGTPIVCFGFLYTAHDGVSMLIRLDLKAGTARIVPIDADDIEIYPSRRRFLALSNRRIESYGDLGLWTSSLYVGEVPSLRYRCLKLPFGYTVSAALRP